MDLECDDGQGRLLAELAESDQFAASLLKIASWFGVLAVALAIWWAI